MPYQFFRQLASGLPEEFLCDICHTDIDSRATALTFGLTQCAFRTASSGFRGKLLKYAFTSVSTSDLQGTGDLGSVLAGARKGGAGDHATLFNEARIGKMHEKSIGAEGRAERDMEIACNALKMNMSIDDIIKLTGLIKETVEKLSV